MRKTHDCVVAALQWASAIDTYQDEHPKITDPLSPEQDTGNTSWNQMASTMHTE